MIYGNALFVNRPRTIDDLFRPHLPADECPYTVVKEISLINIDYENFASDMVADRQFLEDNDVLQDRSDNLFRCLLVKRRKEDAGILVVPNGAWVAYAALYMPNHDR